MNIKLSTSVQCHLILSHPCCLGTCEFINSSKEVTHSNSPIMKVITSHVPTAFPMSNWLSKTEYTEASQLCMHTGYDKNLLENSVHSIYCAKTLLMCHPLHRTSHARSFPNLL